MTIWALLVALIICEHLVLILWPTKILRTTFPLALIYLVPIGMIQAVTNRQIGLKCVS